MIADRLTALATDQSDQKTKIERYKALLAELLPTADAPSIKAFAEHVTAEDCALVISRQVLMDLAAGLPSLPVEPLKEIGTYVLERMQPRVTSFEEQISMIREHLADVYEREEEWTEAAKMLAGIPLDSGIRVLEDNYKVEKYIRIAMLYLQDDESVSAETFLNRASVLINEDTSEGLKLQHKVCYARILDAKRKFLEAASRYYSLSQLTSTAAVKVSVACRAHTLAARTHAPEAHTPLPLSLSPQVSEADMVTSLKMAVTCSVLAPAGPQRSRMLGTLYKDERTHSLDTFPMLEKMFMERLLKAEEVKHFEAGLADHQKATLEDGSTVLDRAVIEHNMLATSKLYLNITFEQLGLLLGIDGTKAERIAASMLAEKRLNGSIDQPESRILFDHRGDSKGEDEPKTGQPDGAESLRAFDHQIENICRSVEAIANAIVLKHPEFAAQQTGAGPS